MCKFREPEFPTVTNHNNQIKTITMHAVCDLWSHPKSRYAATVTCNVSVAGATAAYRHGIAWSAAGNATVLCRSSASRAFFARMQLQRVEALR